MNVWIHQTKVVATSQQPGIPYQQSAIDAVDEYVERERRKINLIIHNFPEQTPEKCQISWSDKVQEMSRKFRVKFPEQKLL